MVYCIRRTVKWPGIAGSAGQKHLLYATTNAPVGADRQWSTVFDAPLNGRDRRLSGMNNGCLLYTGTWSTVFDARLNGRVSPVMPCLLYATPG
jgi:hypothetical protein